MARAAEKFDPQRHLADPATRRILADLLARFEKLVAQYRKQTRHEAG